MTQDDRAPTLKSILPLPQKAEFGEYEPIMQQEEIFWPPNNIKKIVCIGEKPVLFIRVKGTLADFDTAQMEGKPTLRRGIVSRLLTIPMFLRIRCSSFPRCGLRMVSGLCNWSLRMISRLCTMLIPFLCMMTLIHFFADLISMLDISHRGDSVTTLG